MPTLDYLTGFNHQVASLGATLTGAPTIDTATVRHTGGSSLRIHPSASIVNAAYAPSSQGTILVGVVYVNFASLPTGDTSLFVVNGVTSPTGFNGIGYQQSSGEFAFYIKTSGGGLTLIPGGPTVVTSAWYRLELSCIITGGNFQLLANISDGDGSLLTDLGGGLGSSNLGTDTIKNVFLGAIASATSDAYFTDLAFSLQSSDYPVGPISVYGYTPNSVGTHNLDASTSTFFFTDTSVPPGSAGTALTTSETTSYQMLDEIPLGSGTDAVKVTRTTGAPNTPTFRTAGTWSFTANNVATPFTCTPGAPAGTAVGDLLLLVCESRSIVGTVATPSGWNLMTNFPKRSGTASGGSIYLFTRIADGTGSDTPSPVWANLGSTGTSGDASGAGLLCYTNASVTQDATAVSQDLSAQGSTSSITGITTATDKSLVVNVAMKLNETSSQTASVTTYTEDSDNSTTSGTGHIVQVSHLVKTPLGASGAGTITWSGTTSARALIATVALKASTPFTQPTATWYAEYGFGGVASQPGAASDPYAVRAIVTQELDTAVSSTWAAKLYDSVQGSNTEDVSNGSISATAQAFVGKTFAQRPNTGGAWTLPALNGTRVRFGYTASAAGDPRLAAAMLEAAYNPNAAPPLPPLPFNVDFAVARSTSY